jgi:hypothetical protein
MIKGDYADDIKKFFKPWARQRTSQRYQYDANNAWTITGVTYEYVHMGNNLEGDMLGLSTDENNQPKYFYAYLHLRNTVKVSETFLADILKQVREYFLNEIKDMDFEHSLSDVLANVDYSYPSLYLEINKIIIDPGFTGHAQHEERDTGLNLGLFSIHHSDMIEPDLIEFIRDGKINIIKLLENPNEYYRTVTISRQATEKINSSLAQLSNQTNSLKRKQLMLKHILKGGRLTFDTEANGIKFECWITWSFEGTPPKIDYEVNHGENYNSKVIGRVRTRLSDQPQGQFVLRVKTDIPTTHEIWNTPGFIEHKVKHLFGLYLEKLMEKNDLTIIPASQIFHVIFTQVNILGYT